MPDQLHPTENRVPVPDPTILTTQQLATAIAALREIMEARIAGYADLQNERFRSIETMFKERDTRSNQRELDNIKAIDAALQAAKEAAAAIDEKTAHLQTLHDEKFHSIAVQFSERDVRAEQTQRDSKIAVDAALQAAKEAVGKSEVATVKQIDQQSVLLQATSDAMNEKIDDVKSRLIAIEQNTAGARTAHASAQSSQIQLAGIVGLIAMFVFGVAAWINRSGDSGPQVIERVIERQSGDGPSTVIERPNQVVVPPDN